MSLKGQCAVGKIEHLPSSDNYRRTAKKKKRVRRVHHDSNSSSGVEGRHNSNEKTSATLEDVEDITLSDLKGYDLYPNDTYHYSDSSWMPMPIPYMVPGPPLSSLDISALYDLSSRSVGHSRQGAVFTPNTDFCQERIVHEQMLAYRPIYSFDQWQQSPCHTHMQYHVAAERSDPDRQAWLTPGSTTLAGTERLGMGFDPSFSNDSSHDAFVIPSTANPSRIKEPPNLLTSSPSNPPICLCMSCDDDLLSEYQCLIRQHIELFEASPSDVNTSAQGRHQPIVLGQVGIRCRYCRALCPSQRPRGAVYYPFKLKNIYQTAQNMATSHFRSNCPLIPDDVRTQMQELLEKRKTPSTGGKQYWADGARVLGIIETDNGLRFTNNDGENSAKEC